MSSKMLMITIFRLSISHRIWWWNKTYLNRLVTHSSEINAVFTTEHLWHHRNIVRAPNRVRSSWVMLKRKAEPITIFSHTETSTLTFGQFYWISWSDICKIRLLLWPLHTRCQPRRSRCAKKQQKNHFSKTKICFVCSLRFFVLCRCCGRPLCCWISWYTKCCSCVVAWVESYISVSQN